MIRARTVFVLLLVTAINLLIVGNLELSFAQNDSKIDDTNVKTNSLKLSEPIYQGLTGEHTTKEISSTPFRVTEEGTIEKAFMKDVGNVTNTATFTNTHFPNGLIQSQGKGTIETDDGQTINWISSDIGKQSGTHFFNHGIIQFNSTNSEKLSFLNNAVGVYKSTPEVKRTIWLSE